MQTVRNLKLLCGQVLTVQNLFIPAGRFDSVIRSFIEEIIVTGNPVAQLIICFAVARFQRINTGSFSAFSLLL